MSDTTTQPSSECDKLLDYVYGELDEAGKRAFEEHLPTCARCQDDVAKLGRVRTAAKRVLPSVEPPASLGGALHAQLMHAAAQRKPRRGILLAFPRKIVEHPALSAAAMFVIVGGFFAYNWSQGKVAMPATEHAEVDAPKPTEAEVPAKREATAEAAPAAEPMMPAAKDKEAAVDNKEGAVDNKPLAGPVGEDKRQMALQTPAGSYTVQRPTAHHAGASTGTLATAAPKKMAPPRMKGIAVDGKAAKHDSLDDLAGGSKDEMNGFGGVSRGVVGGAGGGRMAANEAAKSSAPAQLSRKTMSEESSLAQAAAPPPPPSVVMSTPPAAAPTAPPSRDYYRAQSQAGEAAPMVAKPAGNARSIDQLRKQANDDAKSGRCDEAIKRYQELEKSGTYISPTERVNWVRCLTERGRQDEAQQRLDELKQEKKVTNAQIQDVERELNDSRRRVESKKAKKAPAPADRAPATEATTQQKRAEPPAQSPPDSTNTKVKPSPAY